MKRRRLSTIVTIAIATTAFHAGIARAAAPLFELVGPATYSIPARVLASGPVVVRIPIKLLSPDTPPGTLAVLRATDPNGGDVSAAFTFSLTHGAPVAIEARIALQEIPRAGAYAVRVRALDPKSVEELLDLTFVRAAPVIEASPFVFECVDGIDGCVLSPDHVTFTESSGIAAATNVRVLFKAPLKNGDAADVPPLQFAAAETLPASGQVPVKVTVERGLPLGIISGVASVRSDQIGELAIPVEIHHRKSRAWLFAVLLGGLALGGFRRRVVAQQMAKSLAEADARTLLEAIRAGARDESDPATRDKIASQAKDLAAVIDSAKDAAAVTAAAARAKAAVARLVDEAASARAAVRQSVKATMAELTSLDGLPRATRDAAEALGARARNLLRTLDATPIEAVQSSAEALGRGLASARESALRWVSTVVGIDRSFDGWSVPALASVHASVGAKIDAFKPEGDPSRVLFEASAIGVAIRYWLLGALLGQIRDASREARDALVALDASALRERIQAVDVELARIEPLVNADPEDVVAAAEAVKALRAALVAAFEASAPGSKGMTAALEAGDWRAAVVALRVYQKGRPTPSILGQTPDEPSAPAGAASASPAPARAPMSALSSLGSVDEPKEAARPPATLPSVFQRGGWAEVLDYAIAASLLAGVGYVALEGAFTGSPRDFVVALVWSIGADVTASSVARAAKPLLPASLEEAPPGSAT